MNTTILLILLIAVFAIVIGAASMKRGPRVTVIETKKTDEGDPDA